MTLLSTHHLQVSIANQIVCRDLNLTLQSGEIYGILGPNGSGKTTLLHTLANLHPADAGDIFLGGKCLSTLTPKHIAQQLGILFQDTTAVFAQTVFEFCLNGRHPHLARFAFESEADKNIAAAALHAMQLIKKSAQYVATLSGGERRRLAIATLLTQTPRVYLLDEPMNHLDIHHQLQVLQHFKQLTETARATVVMSLHDINIAQHFCHSIILLFGDGTYLQGPPSLVLTEENLSRLYQCRLTQKFAGAQSVWLPDYAL